MFCESLWRRTGSTWSSLRWISSNRMEFLFEQSTMRTSSTSDKDGKLYTAEDFMTVWEDMTRRSVAPNKAALRLAIPALCEREDACDDDGWKRRKRALIQGYHQAAKDRFDNYVLPIACFSTLIEAAAETGISRMLMLSMLVR
ncbi:hypothetical protein GQ600_4110 [Phytophthora cactorum]|nr:hypothetical protein GQ600_4110 [Phytophthora cactorum]